MARIFLRKIKFSSNTSEHFLGVKKKSSLKNHKTKITVKVGYTTLSKSKFEGATTAT
jgi:hypothetical protein